MNLLLIGAEDERRDNHVIITGRRALHVHSTLRETVGDTIPVGQVGGKMGLGRIVVMERNRLELDLDLGQAPPEPLPVTLVVALPRPKSLKKVLQVTASMGVKELHLIHSYKVDKSYWKSPVLEDESVRDHLLLGLEQGMDTVLPTVTFHRYFKPFVEDVYPGLAKGRRQLIAHPGVSGPCPADVNAPVILAIGPEGGFIDYEVEAFTKAGAEPVSLGERILRVEFAVAATLGRLYH